MRYEGKIVGFAVLEMGDLKMAHGAIMATDPSFQSKGIAKAVMRLCEEFVKS